MAFQHPLGLNHSQFKLIRDCMWARSQVANGHFLPAARWRRAAEKLIERGFLTKAPEQPIPSHGWAPVVFISDENIATYNSALRALEQTGPSPRSV